MQQACSFYEMIVGSAMNGIERDAKRTKQEQNVRKVKILIGKFSAIKKNTFESILMRWMKLEPIIQSEVSQKEKHQYSILMHIYVI